VFLSTFEKQLDAKRRIVVPMEFRAQLTGPFQGVFCFPSIEADCIEAGGKALFDRYLAVIDTAGRITLPETLCDMLGLTDWVSVVGLGERFQIWPREAFQAHRAAQRDLARQGLAELRAQQRAARHGGGG
jgi:MraZ protein